MFNLYHRQLLFFLIYKECLEIDKTCKPRANEQIPIEKEIQMALKTYKKLVNFNHRKKPTIFY